VQCEEGIYTLESPSRWVFLAKNPPLNTEFLTYLAEGVHLGTPGRDSLVFAQ